MRCLPRRDSTTERAMSFRTMSLSSPFLTNDPGTINTKISSSGTLTSQAHCNLQISASRQPVLTANNAISARCGGSKATGYPASAKVIKHCQTLSENRVLSDLRRLPQVTSSDYEVRLHSEEYFSDQDSRIDYFGGFSSDIDQIVLIDPDNGLEPRKSYSDKHLLYSELDYVLGQVSERSVISVFQHFRRKPFEQDFSEISGRILSGYSTAVHWHSLMFVLITRSSNVHKHLTHINEVYASERPVKIIK